MDMKNLVVGGETLKRILYTNLLLALLLIVAIIIFVLVLQPIFAQPFGTLIYMFIIVLSILTAITGIMVFTILSSKKVI